MFESDLRLPRWPQFIDAFPARSFGINYDIGNSAALGYDSAEEISAYAPRILHVHVKDRVRGGTTVPLGTGNADLPAPSGCSSSPATAGITFCRPRARPTATMPARWRAIAT